MGEVRGGVELTHMQCVEGWGPLVFISMRRACKGSCLAVCTARSGFSAQPDCHAPLAPRASAASCSSPDPPTHTNPPPALQCAGLVYVGRAGGVQLGLQLLGLSACLVWTGLIAFPLFWGLRRLGLLRVDQVRWLVRRLVRWLLGGCVCRWMAAR